MIRGGLRFPEYNRRRLAADGMYRHSTLCCRNANGLRLCFIILFETFCLGPVYYRVKPYFSRCPAGIISGSPEVSRMRIAVFVFFPLMLIAGVISVNAQTTPQTSPTPTPEPKPVPCPRVSVQSQGGRTVRDGQVIYFGANIAGGDPKAQPTILWSLSAGVINDGQGTRRISVDTTGAGDTPDREVKADLWVGGYAPECVLQATAAVKVIAPAKKFGEFGELPAETVTFHLKTLAEFLSQPASAHTSGIGAPWHGASPAMLADQPT